MNQLQSIISAQLNIILNASSKQCQWLHNPSSTSIEEIKRNHNKVIGNYLRILQAYKDPESSIKDATNLTDQEKENLSQRFITYQHIFFLYVQNSTIQTTKFTDLIKDTNRLRIKYKENKTGEKLTIREASLLGPCPHDILTDPINCKRCSNPSFVCQCQERDCDQCWANYHCTHSEQDQCEICTNK